MAIEKSYIFKDGTCASYHIVCDNFVMNFKKKMCQGTINCFLNGNIEDCFENGEVKPVKIFSFQFDYKDIVNIETEIKEYVTINIETIIPHVPM